MIKNVQCDICIVGGGLSGLLTALLLSELSASVTLIDQHCDDHFRNPPFDGRTTAISLGSSQIISQYRPNLWAELKPLASSINDIYITHDRTLEYIHYGSQESENRPMGFIFHNQDLKTVLYQHILATANITLLPSTAVKQIDAQPHYHTLCLGDGQSIHARLVVAADGSNSVIRTLFNIKTQTLNYKQTALTFLTHHQEPHQGRAFEHFLPIGPLAFLPLLNKNQSSVIWSLKDDIAQSYLNLSVKDLAAQVNQQFQETLGDLEIISTVHSYPLTCKFVPAPAVHRLILIGDAAHTIHPVAGQGFNLALRDAQQLYAAMHHAQSLGMDITSQTVMCAYQKKRLIDVYTMTGFTDGLVRLFSNNYPVLKALRSQGLRIVNRSVLLKKILVRRAMGLPVF